MGPRVVSAPQAPAWESLGEPGRAWESLGEPGRAWESLDGSATLLGGHGGGGGESTLGRRRRAGGGAKVAFVLGVFLTERLTERYWVQTHSLAL